MPKVTPENIERVAYERYKLDWMLHHGHTLTDLIKSIGSFIDAAVRNAEGSHINEAMLNFEKNGFESELRSSFSEWESNASFDSSNQIWACFNEFLDAEFEDEEYMQTILTDDEYAVYQECMQ